MSRSIRVRIANTEAVAPLGRNRLVRSQEFDHSSYTNVGSPTVTPNTDTAPDGTLSADTIADASAAEAQARRQTVLIPNDGLVHTASVHVKKTVGAPGHFPALNLRYTGGATVDLYVVLNTTTGEVVGSGAVGTFGSELVEKFGTQYWRIWIEAQNNASGNTSALVTFFPAYASTLSVSIAVAAQGSTVFWGSQLDDGEGVAPYVPTIAATVNNVDFALALANLAEVPVIFGPILHPVQSVTEMRPFSIAVTDVDGDFAAQFVTADRWTFIGRLLDVQYRDDDGPWVTYGLGRLAQVAEADGPGLFRLEVADESWKTRKGGVFKTGDTTQLWPSTIKASWRGWRALGPAVGKIIDGGVGLNLTRIQITAGITPGSNFRENDDPGGQELTSQIVRWIENDLIDNPKVSLQVTEGNFQHLRCNVNGVDYPVVTFGDMPGLIGIGGGLSESRRWVDEILETIKAPEIIQREFFDPPMDPKGRMITDPSPYAFRRLVRIMVWVLDNGDLNDLLASSSIAQLFPAYLHAPTALPSADTPLHIGLADPDHAWGSSGYGGGLHPATLTRRVWDELGVAYDDEALADLEADSSLPRLWLRVTEVPKNIEEWMQEHVWGPCMLAGLRDTTGARRLVDMRIPQSVDGDALPVLNAQNTNAHSWKVTGSEAVNSVIWKYLHTERPPTRNGAEDMVSRVQNDGLIVEERTQPSLDSDTLDVLGPREVTFSLMGAMEPTASDLRRLRAGTGEAIFVTPDTIPGMVVAGGADFRSLSQATTDDLFDIYRDGPVQGRIEIHDDLAATLAEGDLVVLDQDSLAAVNPAVYGARSGERIVRLISLSRLITHAEAEYLDVGPNLQPLDSPTVYVAQNDDEIEVTISGVPAGAMAQVELAFTDSSDLPEAYTLRRDVGNETIIFGDAPATGFVHVRARSHAFQRIRSAWSNDALALYERPFVLDLQLSVGADGTPFVQGRPNSVCQGVRLSTVVRERETRISSYFARVRPGEYPDDFGSMTFARADASTCATYVDNAGVLQTVAADVLRDAHYIPRRNHVVRSTDYANATWTKTASGGATAPVVTPNAAPNPVDGAMTATQITYVTAGGSGQSTLAQGSISTTTGDQYTGSVDIMAADEDSVGKIIGFRHVGAVAYTLITLKPYWQRIQVQENAADQNRSIEVTLRPSQGTSDGTVSIFIYHTQIERGSVMSARIPTVASVVTVFDLRTILIETEKQNLTTRASELDHADWTKSRATVTANAETAPDGTATADRLVEDATASATHRAYSANLITVTDGATVEVSRFLKAGTRGWALLGLIDDTETKGARVFFNLSTGIRGATFITGSGPSVSKSGVDFLGNGWYRCWVIASLGSGVTQVRHYLGIASADNTSNYTGNGAAYIIVWGAQTVDDVAEVTSFIPTTSAAVTREPDDLQFTGVDLPNGLAGTFYVRYWDPILRRIDDQIGAAGGYDSGTIVSLTAIDVMYTDVIIMLGSRQITEARRIQDMGDDIAQLLPYNPSDYTAAEILAGIALPNSPVLEKGEAITVEVEPWSDYESGAVAGFSGPANFATAMRLVFANFAGVESANVTTDPDVGLTLTVQCNDVTSSFKYSITDAQTGYISALDTIASGIEVVARQADISLDGLTLGTTLFVTIVPFNASGAAGRPFQLQVQMIGQSVPQGTVMVDEDGNWEATLNFPKSVAETDSVQYAVSLSDFPTRSTVLAGSDFVTPDSNGVATIVGDTPLDLSEKIYISAIGFAGADKATELPMVQVFGSYQSFQRTKTSVWSATGFVQSETSPADSGGQYLGLVKLLESEYGLSINEGLTQSAFVIVSFSSAIRLPPGVTMTEFMGRILADAPLNQVEVLLLKNVGTVLANRQVSQSSGGDTWDNYVDTLSEVVDPDDTYSAVITFSGDDVDWDVDKLACAFVAVTYTMPTPDKAI